MLDSCISWFSFSHERRTEFVVRSRYSSRLSLSVHEDYCVSLSQWGVEGRCYPSAFVKKNMFESELAPAWVAFIKFSPGDTCGTGGSRNYNRSRFDLERYRGCVYMCNDVHWGGVWCGWRFVVLAYRAPISHCVYPSSFFYFFLICMHFASNTRWDRKLHLSKTSFLLNF